MIVKNLKIFSQNICKNSLIVNTLLKTLNQFNIILIQEPLWSEIQKIPSTLNSNGEPLIGTSHHPNWIMFARILSDKKDSPRVLTYVNIHFSSLCFLLWKDIINHRKINLISFFNNSACFYIMNVYSDSFHTALKYLKDTDVVATTRQNGTCSMLTSAKLSSRLSSSGDYKRTRQEALAILILYIYYRLLVRVTTIITCPYVHVLSLCPITHLHVFSLRLPYVLHVLWHHIFNLYCTPWGTHVPWRHP